MNDRFWAKVRKDENGCWNWTGARNSTGYGCVGVNGRRYLTHRFAYEHLVGPIPDGLTIDHLCRNKVCCNPEHLEPVTAAQNNRRAAALITHCRHGHPLAGDNLLITSAGRRNCRECTNARRRSKGPDRRRRENRSPAYERARKQQLPAAA